MRISKANLPYVDDNIFLKLPYNGQYQMIDIIKEKYEDKGIVHYKIGENGKWMEGIPSLKDVGNYDLYYYIEGDRNHSNLRSKVNPFKMNVDMFVPKDDWGTKVDNDGYTNYVASDGKTSTEIDEYGIIWLKEESDGTHAWYGVDNRSKTFALGSRFWVKWLSAERDKEEYQKYLESLDDESKTKAEEGKLWIFLTGVTNPDGVDYTNLDTSIPYYIQLGDDWDEEDVRAYYISEEKDEKLVPEIGSVDYFNSSSDKIEFPENSDYAKLYLKHFSPYVIYDEVDTIYEGLDNNKINDKEAQGNNKVTNYDKSYCNKNTGDDTYIIRYMITMFVISLTILVMLFLELIKRKTSRIGVLLRRLSSAYEVYNLTASCGYNRISNSNNFIRRKLYSKCKFVNFKVHFDKKNSNLLGIVNSVLKTSSDIRCFISGFINIVYEGGKEWVY